MLTKMLGIVFVLLLFAPSAWGASTTYYVAPTGNGSDGLTWVKAYTSANVAVTAAVAVAPGACTTWGNGHTIYVGPGTYANDYINPTSTNTYCLTIYGVSAAGVAASCSEATCQNYPAAKGEVIISVAAGKNGYGFANKQYPAIKNISITGTDSTHDGINISGTSDFLLMDNVYVYNTGGSRSAIISNCGGTIKNSRFEGNATSALSALFEVSGALTSDLTIHNSFMGPSTTSIESATSVGTFYSIHSSGTVNLYNDNIFGGAGDTATVYHNGAGTLNATNNYIGQMLNGAGYTVKRSSGTVNLTNNILVQNWYTTHRFLSGTINTDTDNIKTSHPFWLHRQREGIVMLVVDDSNNTDYVQSLETILSARGVKGNFFIDTLNAAGVAYTAKMQSIYGNGVFELVPHSRTHSDLTLADDANIWTLADCTVTADRTGTGTITIAGGGSGTISDFRVSSLETIRAGLVTGGCTVTDAAYATSGAADKVSKLALGEVIKTAAAGATAMKILSSDTTGATGLFKAEIADSKTYMEATFSGYTAKSWATPFGLTSANIRTAVKTLGILGGRDGILVAGATPFSQDLFMLHGYDIQTNITELAVVGTPNTATETDVKTRTRSICGMIADSGGIVGLLGHNTDQVTLEQWGWIIDAIKEFPEIQILTIDEAITALRASPYSLAADCIDGGATPTCTSSRTWTDNSDFHLKNTSPAINAGTDLGATYVTDYDGNSQDRFGRGWEIGAYAFKQSPNIGIGF